MNNIVVDLFGQCIHPNLHLKREGRNWLLKEIPQIKLKSPNRCAVGFSLDCSSAYFGFRADDPPKKIAKMCDAIIVLFYKNKPYIFVVEQKTGYNDGYKDQLINGKHFCDWLLALLKEHNYYTGEVDFISLLCWQPRENSPRKGGFSRGESIKKESRKPYDLCFESRNQKNIILSELIDL